MLLPRHTLHSILSIKDLVCSTVGIEDGWRGRQSLEATSGFLATRAIAGGCENRPADGLQFHLAASAYLEEVFLLFLVHCDRPFVDPVYEVLLAVVRNSSDLRRLLFSPKADIVCASVRTRRCAAMGRDRS